ncbi:NAD(P)/FAD-dependent oxidoreductase [Amycolatopsis sp. NPDC051071]|uniref:NAD(P)/FAD-dependent oxidoreductase n=1 Tax=Amycolatopsis sp. NPDC051071 TaxID=3154637 RepID=UPI00343A8448
MAIVGGGAGGLSAALVLGRARRSVVVIDAGEPRNAPATQLHGYLTRDGMSPQAFLLAGREEIESYGVQLRRGQVTTAVPSTGGFTLTCLDGSAITARRLILATGLVDRLPDLPGLAKRWGNDVVHCPYCHGWELRDTPTAVLASSAEDLMKALVVSRLSGDTVLIQHELTDAELTVQARRRLAAAHVDVVDARASEVLVENDALTAVRLADGRMVRCRVLYISPRFDVRDEILRQLDVDMHETKFGRYPVTDETGKSSEDGLWIVGNAASATEQVVHAASGGYKAAQAINTSLLVQDLDHNA